MGFIVDYGSDMELTFTKMNGAGNDFVVVDNRDGRYGGLTRGQIAQVCDRHRGVGADGLLAVEQPAPDSGADFTFRYYNADGGEADMCGNGARCFARFARGLTDPPRDRLALDTLAGRIEADFPGGADTVRIRLSTPSDIRLSLPVDVQGRPAVVHHLNTGVPHVIEVVDDLDGVDVAGRGSALRHHPAFFPDGANANFMQVLAPGHIAIRTYERGVEGETLACGTGMVANALAHHLLSQAPSPVTVDVRGGESLQVAFRATGDGFDDVTLTGPAVATFTGTLTLP